MSYTVLYRKYRPSSFNEIVGQKNIVKILRNQIITNKISHAYLFTGTRGTGKTSTAKIFAKNINCYEQINGEACGKCKFCLNATEGLNADVIEIDAASNRGIDEIRDLKEKVNYMPTIGKYRVYIIDEVHMLTQEAFNALLKTLEEPPKHIVFIFATTEPNKIPQTILSRCQRFDFSRIPKEEIEEHIKNILSKENIFYEDEAISLIALTSSGALRDALSLLDKALPALENNTLTLNCVRNILGLTSEEEIFSLGKAIIEKKPTDCLIIFEDLLSAGKETEKIIDQLIEFFRDILVVSTSNSNSKLILKDKEYINSMKTLSGILSNDEIAQIITHLYNIKTKMKLLSFPQFLFESELVTLSSKNFMQKKFSHNKGNYTQVTNKNNDILYDELNILRKEVKELKNFIKNTKFQKSVEKTDITIKETHKQITENTSKSTLSEINEANKLIKDCATYISNRYREQLVATMISHFKVVDVNDKQITIFPGESLNAMDTFDVFDGNKLLKETLKEKTGKNLEIIFVDKITTKINTSILKKEVPQKSIIQNKNNSNSQKINEIKTGMHDSDYNSLTNISKENLEEFFGELIEIDE